MALNISAWSIQRPLPPIVGDDRHHAARLRSASPSCRSPACRTSTSRSSRSRSTQFGAAPPNSRTQVTKAIEDGVSGVDGVRHILSSITDGVSNTTIQFRLETDTDRALNNIKDAVTRVRANLPSGINEPLIQRVDVIGLPILTYAADLPRQNAGAAVVFRRRRRQTRAAGRARRRPRRAHRRRRAVKFASASIPTGCRRSA